MVICHSSFIASIIQSQGSLVTSSYFNVSMTRVIVFDNNYDIYFHVKGDLKLAISVP